MKLHIVTIVLNGQPWLAAQWTNLVKSNLDWTWHVVEGASANTHCTSWCKRIPPQYSHDGTGEFLRHISHNKRVKLYRKPMWDGKVEMFNTALEAITEPGVLLQMDSDEIWTADQLSNLVRLFHWNASYAMFWCRYFFGPDIVMTTRNCYANNPNQEWKRAWKFNPGDKFISHEPPKLSSETESFVPHDKSEQAGLVFDHYGYASVNQVAFKEEFYGYQGAVRAWMDLQANEVWPARLCDFLPWVKDTNCMVERI